MNFFNKHSNKLDKNSVSFKLVFYTIIFSSLITFLITSIQLLMDYRAGIDSVEQQFYLVKKSYIASIKQTIWVHDIEQLKLQLNGVLNLPDILKVKIILDDGKVLQVGDLKSRSLIVKSFDLKHEFNNQVISLGTMIVTADLHNLYHFLRTKVVVILVSQGLKTFLTTFFILILVHHLIIRHLNSISKYSESNKLNSIQNPLFLEKEFKNDELDKVAQSINKMCKVIKSDASNLENLNIELEERVKRRTMELSVQKKVFEKLFYDATDAIVIGKNGFFEDCNDAALGLLAYAGKDQLIGKSLTDVSPILQPSGEKSHKLLSRLIKQTVSLGKNRFEWVLQRLRGEPFWSEIFLTKISINKRNIIHMVIRDISKQKELQKTVEQKSQQLKERYEQLQKTQDQLIQSEKMAALGNMVAGVAHEINTPVGVALTGVSYLNQYTQDTQDLFSSQKLTAAEFNEFLDINKETTASIQICMENAAQLISSFKKIAVDQTKCSFQYFNIKTYLDEIISSLRVELKKTNISVSTLCKKELEIYSDPGALSQIITNLVMNSLTHAFQLDDTGEICIEVNANQQNIEIKYKDDGTGIATDVLPKIFDPFFTTNRKSGGTGLGLHIIFNIIHAQLNGDISAQSVPGQGTEFLITLPIFSQLKSPSQTIY